MLVRSRRTATLALAMVAGLGSVGCAAQRTSAPRPGTPPSTVANDPVLEAAAREVRPTLEQSFPDSYAGLTLDQQHHLLIVYRRPDRALDSRIRAEVPGTRVVFRDSPYSWAQMQQVIDRITGDTAYWRARGIAVNGALPQPDGTGVTVLTSRGTDRERRELSRRYTDMTITVRKRITVHPTGPPAQTVIAVPAPSGR